MDASIPGEAGVVAWCNSIRFAMANDPGRQFLHEQIQREGFDFLDMYLENFLSVSKHEPVIELLKTPGRKKNVPARTRAATTAAAKSQAVISLSFEDGDSKENREPINNFHKALLQAKDGNGSGEDDHSTRQRSADMPTTLPSRSLGKLKSQRIVTIADSPAVHVPELPMEVDTTRKPLPALTIGPVSPVAQAAAHEEQLQESKGSVRELSMIAEDDESVERSRHLVGTSAPAQIHLAELDTEPTRINENQDVFHEAATRLSYDIHMRDDSMGDMSAAEAGDSEHDDTTSLSATTFHTVPLSPRAPNSGPSSGESHTEPLPRVSLPPVPVEEGLHSHTAPLPTVPSQHEEYTMPLRDEPSQPVPGLSRKPSVSQFTGLPAPSPLRKSIRNPNDTLPGTSAAAIAPLAGGKRTSTSWLSKARETKAALDNTTQRASTLGLGASIFSANKRKSSEMLEVAKDAATAVLKALDEEEERMAKVQKLSSSPTDLSTGKAKAASPDASPYAADVASIVNIAPTASEVEQVDSDMLTTLLKKNYGARMGKSMGKSLGGNAAAALAEARAAAEARVAERHKLEMGIEDISMTSEEKPPAEEVSEPVPPQSPESVRRLSMSDLIQSSQGKGKEDGIPSRQPTPPAADASISTTPPHSPPRSRTTSVVTTGGPVFSRPVAPLTTALTLPDSAAPSAPRDFKLPTTNPFTIPAAMALGMGGPKFVPLSAQSSKASVFSDVVFDRNDASPAWMPSTQDTSYSAVQSQGSQPKDMEDNDELDEDDSWGVDEKFAADQMWTPFGFQSSNPDQLKDETMTWSTYPSRSTSQKGADTDLVQSQAREEEENDEPDRGFAERLTAADQQRSDADEDANEEADIAMEIDEDEVQNEFEKDELEDVVLAGKSTIKLVQKSDSSSQPRSDSQQSMTSTSSSQSNLGFFGTASKLVSSVLGGGKKAKPEVKSLQLAAAAAKKQQEEQEKKAQRMKEMEARRQQVLQRKAEEEKARQLEEERKIKEEAERRKREREEHTDKRPLRSTTAATKKAEDDTTKRKLAAAPSQKPSSKDKKDSALPRQIKPSIGAASKPALKSALKQPSSSSVPITPGASKAPVKSVKHVPSSSNLKVPAPTAVGKGKEKDVADQPQAASRPKTPAPPPPEPRVASESIELPDINSEYSDSEDEDRPKRDLPDWAKSPDIAAALQQQSTINPDDIFGRIGPLRMEEIFRTRHSRFRARTSSANWTGTDELTAEEEREYARRMGFKS